MIKLEVKENEVQGVVEGNGHSTLSELVIGTFSILEQISKGAKIGLDELIDMYATVIKDPDSIEMFKKETADVPPKSKSKVVIKRKGGKSNV